jgi:hypothetical protein
LDITAPATVIDFYGKKAAKADFSMIEKLLCGIGSGGVVFALTGIVPSALPLIQPPVPVDE